MEKESSGKKRESSWITGFSTLAVIVVVVIALAYGTREPEKQEVLLPTTANITFTGTSIHNKTPDQVALRLHNFIVLCANGDLSAAAGYLDPKSRLVDRPEVACGPVTSMINPAKATIYQFDRVDATPEEATVYVTTREPPQLGERYTFFMRKVHGEWYFSMP